MTGTQKRCTREMIAWFVAVTLCGCKGDDGAAEPDHVHPGSHDHGGAAGSAGAATHAHPGSESSATVSQSGATHDHEATTHDHADSVPGHTHLPADPVALESLPPGWTAIDPGGETTCARGEPYTFFVRPGTLNRVVVEFRGGGACWDEATCMAGSGWFTESPFLDRFVFDEREAAGLRDHADERNPFKDWHHVFIPYCTGDTHAGDATLTYGTGESSFSIQHKGAVNTRAVLEWLYASVAAPDKVFVTGCSAGGNASLYWVAHVREHYENARVYQFADSGSGVVAGGADHEGHNPWNSSANYPTFIPGAGPEAFEPVTEFYETIGNHFPDLFLSQYNSYYDDVQHRYHVALGGSGDVHEFAALMQESIATITETTPNFRSYTAAGWEHCVLPYSTFYTSESGGVKLIDWLTDVIDDRSVDSVSCGDDCGTPVAADSEP